LKCSSRTSSARGGAQGVRLPGQGLLLEGFCKADTSQQDGLHGLDKAAVLQPCAAGLGEQHLIERSCKASGAMVGATEAWSACAGASAGGCLQGMIGLNRPHWNHNQNKTPVLQPCAAGLGEYQLVECLPKTSNTRGGAQGPSAWSGAVLGGCQRLARVPRERYVRLLREWCDAI
jgi:hypothetical protein